MAKKKLGEMLIEAGVLDELGLRSALADQRRWGRSLGRTLVEMRLVDESVLVQVLSQQLNVESIDLDAILIPPDVLRMVPTELVRQARIMPFRVVMKFLDVAMGDPTNMGLVDELRIRTQLNIRPFLCGPRQIERTIARYYGDGSKAEIVIPFEGPDAFDLAQPPPAAPRTTTRQPAGTAAPVNTQRTPSKEGLRPFPRTIAPPAPDAPADEVRDAEITALQIRISKLEALVERDEAVLKRLLALLIEKGVATREEIVERLS